MSPFDGVLSGTERMSRELREIIDFVSDGVLVTDQQSRVVMVNKNHALLEFATPDEIIGKTIPELVDQGYYIELKPIELQELKEVLKSKKVVNFEMITRTRRRLFITANPILDESGDIRYIVYTSRDVTEFQRLRNELEKEGNLRRFYEEQLRHESDEVGFAFQSEAMRKTFDIMVKVSQVESPVFLTGESGVGKGLIAHKIHELSIRSASPFVHVNCAAIPESLFESEVFGYEQGSFTGARKQGKPGLLELAGDGTVFLDEIGELPYPMQAKLLQVLQEAVFRRVGGITPIKLKARIISATNRNIEEMMRENKFREDLYYRLCVFPINVPSLSERREDILLYAELFLERYNIKYGTKKRLAREVKDWMLGYSWPGNVRELQNMIERLAIISESDEITLREIPESYRKKGKVAQITLEESISLKEANEKMERLLVERVLRSNRTTREAARALGVSQATLLRKASKYGFSCSAVDRLTGSSH